MKPPLHRRTLLLAAATLTAATLAGTVPVSSAAQSEDIRGTITFEGDAVIPKGSLRIYVDDPAVGDKVNSGARLASDGGSKTMDFRMSSLSSSAASHSVQVVALLEREDGWLLARGSAKPGADASVHITLYKAMY